MLVAATGMFAQNIDLTSGWDGSEAANPFGPPNTETYGQTITLASAAALSSFNVRMNCPANVTARAHVYAWNGTRATGADLLDGTSITITGTGAFQTVSFNTGSINLPAGQYVLFASTSQDTQTSVACRWGVQSDIYAGGQFVFINNGTDTTQWTSTGWSNFSGQDLAFQAIFGASQPVGTPTLSEWGMILLACLLGGAAFLKLKSKSQVSVN